MPTISWFLGISIRMYFGDHAPPHFHAYYGDDIALVAIADGEIIRGRLPAKQARLVREWALRYNTELMVAWNKAQHGPDRTLGTIPGLEK